MDPTLAKVGGIIGGIILILLGLYIWDVLYDKVEEKKKKRKNN